MAVKVGVFVSRSAPVGDTVYALSSVSLKFCQLRKAVEASFLLRRAAASCLIVSPVLM